MITEDVMQPDVKVVLDLKGVIQRATLANAVAEETLDDWRGRRWAETVEGVDRAQLGDLVRTALAQGVSPYFRLTQRFPSGLSVPIEYMAVRLKGGDVVAIGRDVRAVAKLQSRLAAAQHEKERNYWQLREAENRYRTLFEASTDPLAVVRASDFSIVEANPAAIAVLGLAAGQPTEVDGYDFLDLVECSQRKMVEVTFRRAREHGKAPRIVVRLGPAMQTCLINISLLDVDQAEFMLVNFVPSNDESAVVPTDPHAGLANENTLGLAPDGVVALDEDGYITAANPVFLELVEEGTAGSVIGRSLGEWINAPGGDLSKLLDELRRDGVVRLFPTTVQSRCGNHVAAELAAAINNTATPAYILVYVRDVSRRLGGDQLNGCAPLAQLLGSMAEQFGTTTLKGLIGATVGLVEKHYIEAALVEVEGNRTAAAKLLGLSRQSLYVKMARYGINDNDETTG